MKIIEKIKLIFVEFASKAASVFWKLIKTLIDMLTNTGTTLAEFQSSTTLLVLGWVFLNPWPTLTLLPVYNSMLAVMPEWAWGVACALLGAWQSASNLRHDKKNRRLSAFVIACFFGFLMFLLMMSSARTSPQSPFFGVPTYPVIPFLGIASLTQAFVYLHLSVGKGSK